MICPICEESLANWRWLNGREKGKEKEKQCEMARLGDKRKIRQSWWSRPWRIGDDKSKIERDEWEGEMRERVAPAPRDPCWKQFPTSPPPGRTTTKMSTSSSLLVLASLVSGFTLQPTLPSGPRGLTSAQLASSGSVAAPLPHLTATKQYRGATVRAHTEQVEWKC